MYPIPVGIEYNNTYMTAFVFIFGYGEFRNVSWTIYFSNVSLRLESFTIEMFNIATFILMFLYINHSLYFLCFVGVVIRDIDDL